MPTIKIDDEVYAWIKARAIPLEDDANSVLRRECGIGDSNGKGRPAPKRIAHGERTPQEEFREPLLRVLYEAGGSLKRVEAIEAVGELMKDLLHEVDRQSTKSGHVRWQHYVEFERHSLVHTEGLLKEDSPNGVWELTAKGIKEAKRLFGESR
jgi:hypothetical protein